MVIAVLKESWYKSALDCACGVLHDALGSKGETSTLPECGSTEPLLTLVEMEVLLVRCCMQWSVMSGADNAKCSDMVLRWLD